MKNKSYPLNSVPQINDLKNMVIYCAETYKNSTAFQFERNKEIVRISFQEFLDDINGLGTTLHYRGLLNVKIALISENSYEWLLSYFAVINGGNIVVPIDPEIQYEQIKQIIKKTEVSAVICSQKCFEKIQYATSHLPLQEIIVIEKDMPELIMQKKAEL